MSDDIVDRLRQWAPCWPDSNQISIDLRIAADEIERLRRNIGCARNQRTTQFCAEAVDAQRDVEKLRTELVRNSEEFRGTLAAHRRTIECLTAERDSTIRELRKVETECSMLRVECGVVAADEIELLRSTVTDCRIEIERLRAERDEARRLVCRHTKKLYHTLKRTAELRGWDCFKEERNA